MSSHYSSRPARCALDTSGSGDETGGVVDPDETDTRPRSSRQPYLFDLVSCVNAPSVVLSAADGQILEGGVQGWLRADRRCLSRLHVTVGGYDPVGLGHDLRGAAGAVFRGVVPQLGDPAVGLQADKEKGHDDPTVFVERTREVGHDDLVETVTVTSTAPRRIPVVLGVTATSDLSTMAEVRSGRPQHRLAVESEGDGLTWTRGEDSVVLHGEPSPDDHDTEAGTLSWTRELAPGESVTVRLHARVRSTRDTLFGGTSAYPWSRPAVTCADLRIRPLVVQGLDDLAGLLLDDKGDAFVSAGSPWFLTLFGRDSLWTARMMLPLGTDLAMSTLRALARRQGTRDDEHTEEQPGRILHEVRPEPLVLDSITLPPTYYGTSDATQLFVICCAEAWRWGADDEEVAALLPAVGKGLEWIGSQAGVGFISYVDTTGSGLSNHGWKDSVDSIQWADGRLAEPPIALSEVQGYAYQAAVLGADLLDAFGRPGAERWRTWAAELADRFRARFWVEDDAGRFPAVALDGRGAPVDSVASNMAHLLGTGLLTDEEAGLVARRLASPEMDSGFGLRTLTAASPRFSRLSYHGGTVWPHDTVIAVAGLARDGFGDVAASLFQGLVRAAPSFDYRLPELYGGDAGDRVTDPTPYPAACRPQAWAAAAPLAALVALLGLDVDVPRGQVSARPVVPASLLPLTVSGLRVAGHDLEVRVDARGRATLETDHPTINVQT
ncbi:MAG TPA: glycogen debranching N-terminal domain-containing protein [Nocardioidaceae bacterium]|nr:glycogen debranching N-terminal domain-containing protein [Nocardioidaceae bacterium]